MPLQIRRYILSDWTVAVSVRYSCATNRKTQDISFVQVCVLHKCATFEIWSLTKATQLQHQSQTRLILFESFTSHVVEQDFRQILNIKIVNSRHCKIMIFSKIHSAANGKATFRVLMHSFVSTAIANFSFAFFQPAKLIKFIRITCFILHSLVMSSSYSFRSYWNMRQLCRFFSFTSVPEYFHRC